MRTFQKIQKDFDELLPFAQQQKSESKKKFWIQKIAVFIALILISFFFPVVILMLLGYLIFLWVTYRKYVSVEEKGIILSKKQAQQVEYTFSQQTEEANRVFGIS